MPVQSPEQQEVRDMVVASVGTTSIDFKKTVKQLSKVLEELSPRGEDSKLANFIDQEITVWNVQPFLGEYGPAAWVLFTDPQGQLFNTVIGQKIVLPKLLIAMDDLPVKCTVKVVEGGRFGHYYDLE